MHYLGPHLNLSVQGRRFQTAQVEEALLFSIRTCFPPASMMPPQQIRQQIRRLRAGLPSDERQRMAQQVAARVLALPAFDKAEHIAGYFAFAGELDPKPLLDRARELGKHTYLPVIAGKDRLLFAPYRPGDKLKPNRFSILEPDVPERSWLPPPRLDLVLTPLVAFDNKGNRLGMGAGFYDRSFEFLNRPERPPWPRLVGLAYEIQKVTLLRRERWDIPLDAVVTEAALYPAAADEILA